MQLPNKVHYSIEDFNSSVGTDFAKSMPHWLGKYSLEKANEKGFRLRLRGFRQGNHQK